MSVYELGAAECCLFLTTSISFYSFYSSYLLHSHGQTQWATRSSRQIALNEFLINFCLRGNQALRVAQQVH